MNRNQMPYGLLGPIPTYNPGLLAPKTSGAMGGYNMNDPSKFIGSANIADVAKGSTAYIPNGNPINPGMNASKMPADWVQRLFGANREGTGGRSNIAAFLQHMNPEAIQRLVAAGHIPNDWASQLGIQNPNLPNGSMPGGMGNPLPGQASSR